MKIKENSKAVSVKKEEHQAKTEKGHISKLSANDLEGYLVVNVAGHAVNLI